MSKKVVSNLVVEGAKTTYRNFAGVKKLYNNEGERNFNLILDAEIAEKLKADGWNVKYQEPRDEGGEGRYLLEVKVSFSGVPPQVFAITESRGMTALDANTVGMLDWARFRNVDLVVGPYNWEVDGRTGITAYLRSLYATIDEDEFAVKYKDVPLAAQEG